jgi:hypothetical protein
MRLNITLYVQGLSCWIPDTVTQVSCGHSQSVHANSVIVTQIRQPLLPFVSFQIHSLQDILSFRQINPYEPLLNKQHLNKISVTDPVSRSQKAADKVKSL